MPRNKPGSNAGNKSGRNLTESEQIIERGIDDLNALRAEMRKTGMTKCADVLDAAFACCLQEYVTQHGQAFEGGTAEPGGSSEDNLN